MKTKTDKQMKAQQKKNQIWIRVTDGYKAELRARASESGYKNVSQYILHIVKQATAE
jgi:hypothetical protein